MRSGRTTIPIFGLICVVAVAVLFAVVPLHSWADECLTGSPSICSSMFSPATDFMKTSCRVSPLSFTQTTRGQAQTFTFTVTSTGGIDPKGVNTYQWSGDAGSGSGSTFSVPLSAPGTYTEYLTPTRTSPPSSYAGPGGQYETHPAPSDPSSCSVQVTITPPPPVKITEFAPDDAQVYYGGSTTIKWSADNAESCTMGGDWPGSPTEGPSGSQTISDITGPMNFTMECDGEGAPDKSGSTSIGLKAPSVTLKADPNPVGKSGDSSNLTWTIQGATSCITVGPWDSGIDFFATDNWTTGPITDNSGTTFTLKCSAPGTGYSPGPDNSVTVYPPQPPAWATAPADSSITSGQTGTISWNAQYANSCTVSTGGTTVDTGGANDSYTTPALSATTAYTVSCTGPGSSSNSSLSKDVTVSVTPPTCTSFTYSTCANGTQTVVSSSPSGCTGGSPVLTCGGSGATCDPNASVSQCAEHFSCDSGYCMASGSDLSNGSSCNYDNSQCHSGYCNAHGICAAGVLNDPCNASNANSCSAGLTCQNGYCEQNNNSQSCTPACSAGQMCQNGQCVSNNAGQYPGGPVTGTLPNPLCLTTDPNCSAGSTIYGFIANALKTLVSFLVPLIVLFYVITGLMFVTARGNPQKLVVAKQALLYTTIGAAVVLGAWALAQAISSTIGSVSAGS